MSNVETPEQQLNQCAKRIKAIEGKEVKIIFDQLLNRIKLGTYYLQARHLHKLTLPDRQRNPDGTLAKSSEGGFERWIITNSTVSKGHVYNCIHAAEYFNLGAADADTIQDEQFLSGIRSQIDKLAEAHGSIDPIWSIIRKGLPAPDDDADNDADNDDEEDTISTHVRNFVTSSNNTANRIIEEAEELDRLAGRRKRDKAYVMKAKTHSASKLLAALEHLTGQTFDTSKAKSRKWNPVEFEELASYANGEVAPRTRDFLG